MADDPINIQVTDNIDPNVAAKLNAIADAADKGSSNLDQLQAALASIQTNNLDTLRQQATTATTALQAEMTTTKELSSVSSSANAQTISLGSAMKSLRAETDNATASIKANTDALTAQQRAAQMPAGFASTIKGNTTPIQIIQSAGNSASGGSQAAYNAKLIVTQAAQAQAAAAAAAQATNTLATASNTAASAGKVLTSNFTLAGTTLAGAAPTALAAGKAIEDVGSKTHVSSLAIREFVTIGREISSGNFTRLPGSISLLAQAFGLLNVAIPVAVVGFGALYAARSNFNTDDEKKKLSDYADTLGLTSKEMRKLSDTTLDAEGHLKTVNQLQITYMDTLHGFINTVKEGTNAHGELTSSWDKFVSDFKVGINAVYTGLLYFMGGLRATGGLIEDMGTIAADVLTGNLSGAADAYKKLTDDTNNFFGDTKKNADDLRKNVKTAYDEIGKQSGLAAQRRIKDQADAIIANRNPKKESTADPKDKDDYLDDENKKLDDQLKTFGMLKQARDVQTQLDAVEEAFQKRRMPLNDAEIKQFRDKIVQIQENNRVQAQMDSIYDDLNGAQQKYNDGYAALLELQERGNITAQQAIDQNNKLVRSLQEATDPLFAIKQAYQDQERAVGKYGDALTHQQNVEKVYQAYLAKGIDLRRNASQLDIKNGKDMVSALDGQDQKKYVADQVGQVVDPLLAQKKFLANSKDYYAQLADMYKKDEITSNQYTQAKYALDAKLTQAKLQGTSDALDQISQLSSSKNKELAAIGKAAAVANATIKGVEAVQTALASAPPPFNFALAALVGVAAAANVAKIVNTPTDTGSYWTGGDFIVRGKTGVDSNRIAMNVSDGERVTIQTQAQQQAAATGQNNTPAGDTHVNNFFDEESFLAAMATQRGDKIIMNAIGRNPKQVAGLVKG